MDQINEKIYAGVLGKMIGVYLGRPVEGWSYERINKEFGLVDHYVHSQIGADLIEADDDLSGTFTFVRCLEENGYPTHLSAKQIGNHWLNKIIEEKTIFWWGGMFRSTEHTAYLRLKEGIEAPESGSMKLNGRITAEQIGSQIFIDGWGLVNPNQPQRAYEMAKAAAQVSHDGIAVSMAAWIAVLESLVFEEKNWIVAMRQANQIVQDPQVSAYVEEMIQRCERNTNWRVIRDEIQQNHPYSRYGGNCPIVTNFLSILMALLLDEDQFRTAITISVSAGWDTDCNAGNVGCLEAIRLGLSNIEATAQDLREEMNERLYVVNAQGGSVMQNATSLAKELIVTKDALLNIPTLPTASFTFDFAGSTHSFSLNQGKMKWNEKQGVTLQVDNQAEFSIDTFGDPRSNVFSGYALIASPLVYPGQTCTAKTKLLMGTGKVRWFVDQITADEKIERQTSFWQSLSQLTNLIWTIPAGRGYPIVKMGLELQGSKLELNIEEIDYYGEPDIFYDGLFTMTPAHKVGRGKPSWYQSWVDSTHQSDVDHLSTFCCSDHCDNGLLTIGNQKWKNTTMSADLILSMQSQAGLILRSTGLRRYAAAILEEGKLRIIEQWDKEKTILAEVDYAIEDGKHCTLCVSCNQSLIEVFMDGHKMCQAQLQKAKQGGVGFLISRGTMQADQVKIKGSK